MKVTVDVSTRYVTTMRHVTHKFARETLPYGLQSQQSGLPQSCPLAALHFVTLQVLGVIIR